MKKRPEAKPWWRSKTLWLNATVGALVALEGSTGVLQPVVPVNIYAVLAAGLPVLNAVLRILTTQGVTLARGRVE